ncbi:DNA polymerase III subunit alpha [Alphaproteobacteria bacterium]|nr:DNA polymerase III subunit alpha [Alphaproteobacteria bacterium]
MKKPFIHLRSLSSYSLAESTLKIPKLINLAKKNNMPAIALTDNNNMFGALEFAIEASQNGIQPIIGTCINFLDIKSNNFSSQVNFLVKNEEGYKNLLYLSSLSHTSDNNPIGIFAKDLVNHTKGLICYIGGEYNPLLILKIQKKDHLIKGYIEFFKKSFQEDFLFELQRVNTNKIDEFENEFIIHANEFNIPLIASNNIKFENKEDFSSHDALLCIAQKTTINQTDRKNSNPELYFKNSEQMSQIFSDIPDIIDNNLFVSKKCNFFPVEINPRLPKFTIDSSITETDLLNKKSNLGLKKRCIENNIKSSEPYEKRLIYELDIINKMGFAGYFLIVSDFVNWAKNNNIAVGPGRGSGAGSVVAWSLLITDLDPLQYNLLFERFLNPERVSMPDFDIDFCQNRRDEVIEYVNNKYGKDSVAHIITFGTLASRAAFRDVGRVLEIPYSEVDQFAKLIPYNPANPLSLEESINSDKNLKDIVKNDERIANVVDISLKLEGLHRHASTHAAGVVIGDTKIIENVPLYKDPNTSVNATQFSMKYVEKAGLIKFDFLGLTTLSIIQDTTNLIKKRINDFNLKSISMDDKKTFENLSNGETIGIFQLESNGMGSVLRQLQPNKFEEIIAVVALFRPGPMDNIPSFCARKHGKEEINYIHPLMKNVLKETYGIIVYQEQVMEIAQVLSNYSLGEADLLRRAMGKKIQKEMDAQKNRFIDGAKKNKIQYNEASKIFDLVNKFAGYGFNKSHAAGYALLAYQTAYLKTTFPFEFMTATLNYSIDRTDRIILLKKEVARLNIEFKKPEINFSYAEFSIEEDNGIKSIRFGLAAIKGVGIKSMQYLVEERNKNGKYKDIIDFMTRLRGEVINKRQLEKLIQAGCFDELESNRAKLFANVKNFVEIFGGVKDLNLNQSLLFEDSKISFLDQNLFQQNINPWSTGFLLKSELEVIGFYFSNHPLSLYPKNYFDQNNIVNYKNIIDNSEINNAKIVGSILDIKERSNKEGKKYAFLTISTLESQIELSIFNDQLSEYRKFIKEGNVLLFYIDISRNNENIRLVIRKIKDFDKSFQENNKTINIYLQKNSDYDLLHSIIEKCDNSKENLFIYMNKNGKLLSFDFSKKYRVKSYKIMDSLMDNKKIDYSIEFIENT